MSKNFLGLYKEIIADFEKSGINSEYRTKANPIEIPPDIKLKDKSKFIHEILGYSANICHRDFYFFPYKHISEEYYRVKVLNPRENEPKYWSPSKKKALPHLYFLPEVAPLLNKIKLPLYITEGEKKAIKLTQETEGKIPVVGCPGVGIWLNCLELKDIQPGNRDCYIFYDMDYPQNPRVQQQMLSWWLYLRKKKARPHVCNWDDNYKGIDDYLASCVDPKKALSQIINSASYDVFSVGLV